MKASWWKYVLLALLTAGVVACGKDNKGGSNTLTYGNPLTNGTSTAVTSSDFATFKNQVAAGQFVAQQYRVVEYRYVDVFFSQQNNNCDKWWIFNVCSSSSQSGSGGFSRAYNRDNNLAQHELGSNIETVHGQLVSIVNSATATAYEAGYRQISPSAWEVRTPQGAYYVIDVSKPVIANPVYYRPANVSTEDGYAYSYFLYWN